MVVQDLMGASLFQIPAPLGEFCNLFQGAPGLQAFDALHLGE